MAFGPARKLPNGPEEETSGSIAAEKSAPVLMDGWMLSAPPIAGMVAVPAIVSRTWKLPLASVTTPPVR